MARPRTRIAVAALLLAAGTVVFVVTLARATLVSPQEAEAPAPTARGLPDSSAQSADVPVRLLIPKLGIDANVQRVGMGKSGNMAVPSNYTDVAWYRLGTIPGFTGSAVMDGHVDNGLALPGVFKHLNEIAPGDELLVRAQNGQERRFVVSEVQVYNYKQVPVERVFNAQDAARLNLITCDGAWVADEKTYDKRLVVYAVLKA